MAKYRKLIVAGIGLTFMALDQLGGISIGIGADQVLAIIVPVLTALGVWGAANG